MFRAQIYSCPNRGIPSLACVCTGQYEETGDLFLQPPCRILPTPVPTHCWPPRDSFTKVMAATYRQHGEWFSKQHTLSGAKLRASSWLCRFPGLSARLRRLTTD